MRKRKNAFTVTARVLDSDKPRTIEAAGRYGQALSELVKAGPQGVTALEVLSWALRMSHYIDVLRKDDRYRLDIETVMEPREVSGMGPGRHARYVLRTPVEILPEVEAA